MMHYSIYRCDTERAGDFERLVVARTDFREPGQLVLGSGRHTIRTFVFPHPDGMVVDRETWERDRGVAA